MKRQKAGIPKSRCEVRLPTDLDARLDKIAAKAGVTRTALMIAAIERFVYGDEMATGVETIHERVAVLTAGQEKLRAELLEARAYLDVLGQTLCNGASKEEKAANFERFLAAVEVAKSELTEEVE